MKRNKAYIVIMKTICEKQGGKGVRESTSFGGIEKSIRERRMT